MLPIDAPVDIEVSNISSELNSIILLIFLMGMYTVIYFGTIYVYLTKHPSKYHPVPVAITILYFSGVAYTAIQWYTTKWQFVDNGDTRQSVFLALIYFPQWGSIASNALICVICVIADALLIWRCFHVWNHSWRIISVSLFLLVTEFALFLTEISFDARYTNSTISLALAYSLDDVLAAAFFMSFGTTLITTVLIAYRIYSVSTRESTSRRFKHIIDIVVQSGAIYALSQFVAALCGVLPGSNLFNVKLAALDDYAVPLNTAIAGISSTVMVARVALLSADTNYPSRSIHLSGLQFHAHSTHPIADVESSEITDSVDAGVLSGEGEVIDKIQ